MAFRALPAGPMSLVRTFSSMVSRSWSLLLRLAAEEDDRVGVGDVELAHRLLNLLLDRADQIDLQVAGEFLAQSGELIWRAARSPAAAPPRMWRSWWGSRPWRLLPRCVVPPGGSVHALTLQLRLQHLDLDLQVELVVLLEHLFLLGEDLLDGGQDPAEVLRQDGFVQVALGAYFATTSRVPSR